jgi:hypothetical protein
VVDRGAGQFESLTAAGGLSRDIAIIFGDIVGCEIPLLGGLGWCLAFRGFRSSGSLLGLLGGHLESDGGLVWSRRVGGWRVRRNGAVR